VVDEGVEEEDCEPGKSQGEKALLLAEFSQAKEGAEKVGFGVEIFPQRLKPH
jgi:hypothetical protein